MGLFSKKQKTSIEEFCGQFYDSQVFDVEIVGKDFSNTYWDTVYTSIIEADESFAKTDKGIFYREMNAIRLELFGLAWGHKFKQEKYTIPQSIFTRQYLEQNDKLKLWDIMGEYNQVVAQSATANRTGEQVSGRTGRALVTHLNMTRSDMWEDWYKANMTDTSNLTKEEEASLESVTRVINRFGADIKREDCVLPKMLASKLLDRVDYKPHLAVEAAFRISAVIFGLHQGALEAMKDIRLQS